MITLKLQINASTQLEPTKNEINFNYFYKLKLINMQIKCLAIGDPHFKEHNIQDCEDMVEKILDLVDNQELDFVVVLGDTLDTHEKIHQAPFNLATRFIIELSYRLPVYLLIGNHDYCNNQQFLTDKHPFNTLKHIDNITVCDKVIQSTFNGMSFVFCPYVPPDRFEEALDTLQPAKSWLNANCIFAHQEFYGCAFNPTQKSTNGDMWPDKYPMVVSGHIHNEQRLQQNIYYTGSSMQHAFGESAKKTVALLTFDNNTEMEITRIDLELRKRKIVYVDIENIDSWKMPKNKNLLIKLVIRGTEQENKAFRKTAKYKELEKTVYAVSFTIKERQTNAIESARLQRVKKSVIDTLQGLIKNDNEYVQNSFTVLKNSLYN